MDTKDKATKTTEKRLATLRQQLFRLLKTIVANESMLDANNRLNGSLNHWKGLFHETLLPLANTIAMRITLCDSVAQILSKCQTVPGKQTFTFIQQQSEYYKKLSCLDTNLSLAEHLLQDMTLTAPVDPHKTRAIELLKIDLKSNKYLVNSPYDLYYPQRESNPIIEALKNRLSAVEKLQREAAYQLTEHWESYYRKVDDGLLQLVREFLGGYETDHPYIADGKHNLALARCEYRLASASIEIKPPDMSRTLSRLNETQSYLWSGQSEMETLSHNDYRYEKYRKEDKLPLLRLRVQLHKLIGKIHFALCHEDAAIQSWQEALQVFVALKVFMATSDIDFKLPIDEVKEIEEYFENRLKRTTEAASSSEPT